MMMMIINIIAVVPIITYVHANMNRNMSSRGRAMNIFVSGGEEEEEAAAAAAEKWSQQRTNDRDNTETNTYL